MADQTRTAEVQLSADVSGYTEPVNQAYQQTNLLISSVNKLSQSLDGITKKTGKKILLFAAADTAALAAYVTIAARYEKQLSTIRAQTDITKKSFDAYKRGINDLSKELPSTRGEIAQLVTEINNLGVTSERETVKMAKVFTNLGAATGENVSQLAANMIELGRAMGTLSGGAGMMEKFTDSLSKVSAELGVSATAVSAFAQNISPFARAAGIGEAALIGISAAFTRAGADGFAAANTLNSIIADITRAVTSGSPDIVKYASAVGMTIESFKELSTTEQVLRIFEAVNAAGAGGIRIMDQLGQDGIRAAKAIQQVSNEAGGLRAAVEMSTKAYGSGVTQEGASTAFDTLDAKLSMIRNNLAVMGSAIGDFVLQPAKLLLNTFNNILTTINGFMEPILKIGGLIAGIVAPVTAAVGGLTTMLGPLSTAMLAFMALRFSPVRSFMEGATRGAATFQQIDLTPAQEARQKVGQNMMAWRAGDESRRPPIYQRLPYMLGEQAGATRVGAGLSRFSLPSLRGLGTMTADLARVFAEGSATWYQDAALRDYSQRRSIFRGPLDRVFDRVRGWAGSGALSSSFMPGQVTAAPAAPFKPDTYAAKMAATQALNYGATADGAKAAYDKNIARQQAAYEKQIKAAEDAAAKTNQMAAASKASAVASAKQALAQDAQTKGLLSSASAYVRASGSLEAFQVAVRRAAGAMLWTYPKAAAGFGFRAAGQAIGAVGSAAGSLLGSLGGLVGLGAGAGAAIAAVGTVGWAAKNAGDKRLEGALTQDSLTNLAPTNIALGEATRTLKEFAIASKDTARSFSTLREAAILTSTERYEAGRGGPKDSRVKDLENSQQAIALLLSMGRMKPAEYNSLIKDITGVLGYGEASKVSRQYLDMTAGGTEPASVDITDIAEPLQFKAQRMNNQGIVGFLRSYLGGTWWGTDKEATDLNNTIWASIAPRADEFAKKYSPEAGALSQQLDEIKVLNSALGGGDSSGAGIARGETIRNFENQYGVDLGLNLGALPDNSDDFYRELWMSDNPEAEKWREGQRALGLNMKDYLDGGAGIEKKFKASQKKVYTEQQQTLMNTVLGGDFMRMQSVNLIGSGEKAGDPQAARRAIDDMTESALANKDAAGSLTTAFIELINKAGGASTYLGQVATAAMKEAEQRQIWNTRNRGGGWEDEYGMRWRQVQQQIFNPRTDEDNLKAAREERQAMRDDLRGRVEQIWLSARNFNIQQERSREEFAIQQERAINQASSSWQNVYTRGANQQALINGTDLTIFNAEEIQGTLTGQLEALRDLTKRGLSKDARNMLDLTNPSMGNQAIYMASAANEDQIAALNELARMRKESVDALTREFSTPFQNAEEDFKRATNNAVEDMKRMGEQSHKTLKQLLKDTTRLAEAGGYGSMAALAAAWDAYNQSQAGTQESKIKGSKAASEDLYTGYISSGMTPGGVSGDKVIGDRPSQNSANQWSEYASTSYIDGYPAFQSGSVTSPLDDLVSKSGGLIIGHGSKGDVVLPDNWYSMSESEKNKFWSENHMFAAGGIARSPVRGTFGEAGPEAVIPLNARGINFMLDVVKGFRTAGYGSPTEYRGVSQSTVYNQNTILSGPMTFVDPDPVKTAKKLQRMNATKNLLRGEAATS